jgi:hypothetical protein
MKKLLSLLSGNLIKDVGNVIDKLTTTDEERLAAKQKLQELLEQADKDAQDQVTERCFKKHSSISISLFNGYIYSIIIF